MIQIDIIFIAELNKHGIANKLILFIIEQKE